MTYIVSRGALNSTHSSVVPCGNLSVISAIESILLQPFSECDMTEVCMSLENLVICDSCLQAILQASTLVFFVASYFRRNAT